MYSDSKLIAVVTNNDDDIYCFRKELIEALIKEGFRVLISCSYGEKFELISTLTMSMTTRILIAEGPTFLRI